MDAGLAILSCSALALVGVGGDHMVGLWIKARLEEQFLSEELGAAGYDGYKARTPMLVLAWRPTGDKTKLPLQANEIGAFDR